MNEKELLKEVINAMDFIRLTAWKALYILDNMEMTNLFGEESIK